MFYRLPFSVASPDVASMVSAQLFAGAVKQGWIQVAPGLAPRFKPNNWGVPAL